jgi:hypothetical protein
VIQPTQHLIDRIDRREVRQLRPRNHDHLAPEHARRSNLTVACVTATVLAHDDIDFVLLQQRQVVGFFKRSTGRDVGRVRHGERRRHRIDAADQIMMLGRLTERREFLAPERQEYVTRGFAQCLYGLLRVGDLSPAIALLRLPGRPAQCHEAHVDQLNRPRRVIRHAGRVRMSGVDQYVDALGGEELRKPFAAPETTDTDRHALGRWCRSTTRERKRHRDVVATRELLGKLTCLGRTTEDKDTLHDLRGPRVA